jgi:phosphate transport system permease protein
MRKVYLRQHSGFVAALLATGVCLGYVWTRPSDGPGSWLIIYKVCATGVIIALGSAVAQLNLPRKARQFYWYAVGALATLVLLFPVVYIVFFLAHKGSIAFHPSFYTEGPRDNNTAGGILNPLIGTLVIAVGTIIVSLPLGIMAAIFLTEYAGRSRIVRLVRLAIVNLAGVPSVVYGLFGLAVFCIALNWKASVAAASATLGLMVLPVVITASEEALLQVPIGYREAALALGSSRLRMIFTVVVPNAVPGILTGIILVLGRSMGETAPILLTCATFYQRDLFAGLFQPVMVLPYHLYIIATQVSPVTEADALALENVQWGTAMALLILTLGVNLLATVIRARLRARRRF